MENVSLSVVRDNWWVVLVRGIVAILFGLMAIFSPASTAIALVLVFGAFALVDGVMALYLGFKRKGFDGSWWTWVLDGLASIAIGLMAFFWTGATLLVMVLWIAAWAIVVGIMRIIGAIRLRKEIEGEWALILSGALMVIWGMALVFFPPAGAISLAWTMGIFSLIVGVMMVILSFRIKNITAAP